MKGIPDIYSSAGKWLRADIAALALALLAGCRPADDGWVQGYAEGEFVYVAPPLAGTLKTLSVERGANVKAGDPLFTLDPEPEQSEREEADRRLAQGRAQLEDARKGKRAPEIEAIEQQLKQARAALALSEKTFTRQEGLYRSGASAANEFDAARAARDQDQHRVSQLEADLQAAYLGSRDDQIAASSANVRALEAALAKADWNLSQKWQTTPQAGLIFDTLYRPFAGCLDGRRRSESFCRSPISCASCGAFCSRTTASAMSGGSFGRWRSLRR